MTGTGGAEAAVEARPSGSAAVRRTASRTAAHTASTRVTEPATSATRRGRWAAGRPPPEAAPGSASGASGVSRGRVAQASAATSCSASSRAGFSPQTRASSATASPGGSVLPPSQRSQDFSL
ncbi:hypothetical protein GCM10020256_32080 [Streptomyces thermocoprophilus]